MLSVYVPTWVKNVIAFVLAMAFFAAIGFGGWWIVENIIKDLPVQYLLAVIIIQLTILDNRLRGGK